MCVTSTRSFCSARPTARFCSSSSLDAASRKAEGKVCTVLDFVGNHRKEFRFDRRFRALIGGSRSYVERQVQLGFPFLPAGCHIELEPIAQEIVLRSLRDAIPSDWRSRRDELVALGDVTLGRRTLDETGLELEDIYAANRSWSELRRAASLETAARRPARAGLLRAVGRLLHIDDVERIHAYEAAVQRRDVPPDTSSLERGSSGASYGWRLRRSRPLGAGASLEDALEGPLAPSSGAA